MWNRQRVSYAIEAGGLQVFGESPLLPIEVSDVVEQLTPTLPTFERSVVSVRQFLSVSFLPLLSLAITISEAVLVLLAPDDGPTTCRLHGCQPRQARI